MTSGARRKGHSGHETTDAFAEGWDARTRAESVRPRPTVSNPYRSEVEMLSLQGTKRARRQIEARTRNVKLWDQGWTECGQDLTEERQRAKTGQPLATGIHCGCTCLRRTSA